MKRKGWLILLVIAVIITAAFVLLSQKIPVLLEGRIEKLLAEYGVEEFHIGEPSWGLSGAGTTILTLRGRSGPWQFDIAIRNPQARYQWRTLLDGDINSLTFESLDATVKFYPPEEETPEEPLQPAQLLADLEALTLPVEDIAIDDVNIALVLESADLSLSGQAVAIDNLAREITGDFNLTTRPRDGPAIPDIAFTAKADRTYPWVPALDIAAHRGERPLVTGTLALRRPGDEGNPQILFSARLEQGDLAEGVSPWLDQDSSLYRFSPLGADLTAEGVISLPQQLSTSSLGLKGLPVYASLRGTLSAARVADTGLSNLKMKLDLALVSEEDDLVVSATSPVTLDAELAADHYPQLAESAGWRGAVPVSVTLTGGEPLAVLKTAEPTQPTAKGENLDAEVNIGDGDNTLSSAVHVNGYSVSEDSYAADIAATSHLPHTHAALPAVMTTTKPAASGDALSVGGNIDVAEWSISGNYKGTVTGKATMFNADLKAGDLAKLLLQADKFDIDVDAIELASGAGTAKVTISRIAMPGRQEPLLVQKYRFAGEGLSGLVHGVAFSGLDFDGNLNNDGAWYSPKPIALSAETISSGVPLADVNVAADLKRSQSLTESTWSVNQFRGKLFSGDIALEKPATVRYPFSGNAMTITLSKLQLSEVLGLYEKQGISGSGLISGEVPVTLTGDGIRIDNGVLRSVEEGRIVFKSGKSVAMKATNQQLAMALRLLENFNYDTLNIMANFATTGDLQLAVTLWGSNPNEFDGRQVNFNITVEDNLYKLFDVLRLSDSITAEIEERLEKNGLN